MKNKFVFIVVITILLVRFASGFSFARLTDNIAILEQSGGARATALGETCVATADNSLALFYNPAGLAYLVFPEYSFSHSRGLVDTSENSFTGVYPVGKIGWGFNISHFDGGEIEVVDTQSGRVTKERAEVEYMQSGGIGMLIGNNISLGTNLKFISINLIERIYSYMGLLDFGFLYKNSPGDFTCGFCLKNIKLGARYQDYIYNSSGYWDYLPLVLDGGVSWRLSDFISDLILNANVIWLSDQEIRAADEYFYNTGLGIEYIFKNRLAIRAGGRYDPRSENFTTSFGCGFQGDNYRLDYAYKIIPGLSDQHYFTVVLEPITMFFRDRLYIEGLKYFDKGKYELAINRWEKIEKNNPNYEKAQLQIIKAQSFVGAEEHYKKGLTLLKLEEYVTAAKEWEIITSSAPNYKNVAELKDLTRHIVQGIDYAGSKRYRSALREYDEALKNRYCDRKKVSKLKDETQLLLSKEISEQPKAETSVSDTEISTETLKRIKESDTKLNLAVADFAAIEPISPSEASFLSELFSGKLINSQSFNIADRKNVGKILTEQAFQWSGCTNTECAVKLGNLLNVRFMVTGNCGRLLDKYILTINVVEVETAQIIYSSKASCYSPEDLEDVINELGERMIRILGQK